MSTQDRREFLLAMARTGAFAGLAALGALLLARGRGAKACAPSPNCRTCAISRTCALRPQGEKSRE
jgi:hypothetical protein